MMLLPPISALMLGATHAFAWSHRAHSHRPSTRLLAAGAPQYEKFQATLRRAENVGEGSVMLHIDTEDEVDYEPGHVLALEMQAGDDGDSMDQESKTYRDAKENGGWMRGPYTVSRSAEKSIDILIKVVGDKSKRFSTAESGTPLRFGGKFHVPIVEGIDAETTKRVVMIATGVGVGPCIGAIEKALEDDSFPPIDLIASYRTEDEVVCKDLLDTLQKESPNKLSWKTIITSKQGRLSASDENLNELANTKFAKGREDTHYHLIGNGHMVSEFKAGLQKAGVPDEKVTIEMYFNHKAETDEATVDRIAAFVSVSEEAAASAAR